MSDETNRNVIAKYNSTQSLLPVFFGVTLAFAVLSVMTTAPTTKFDELALGTESVPVFVERGGFPIHVDMKADQLLEGIRARTVPRRVLWLGNSQLFAINQYSDGEEPAPAILHDQMIANGVDVITVSPPNASLQDHLVIYSYLRNRIDSCDTVLLPVVFDDLRNDGVRPELSPLLADNETIATLMDSQIGRSLIESSAAKTDEGSTTTQDLTEEFLEDSLSEHSKLWRYRAETRGQIFVQLFFLRNWAFGITAQSKRPLIKPRYTRNLAALRAILEMANDDGVRIVTYICPLRNDVAPPYIESEYNAFKSDLTDLVAAYDQTVHNLENLVPGQFWGMKDSTVVGGKTELDFMHFQHEGHKRLAQAMGGILEGGRQRQ